MNISILAAGRAVRRTLVLCASVAVFAGSAHAADALKIGASAISIVNSPAPLTAAKPDLFEAQGIAPEIIDFRGSSPNCINAVLSGDADLCQAGTTTGLDAIAEGAPLKVVAIFARPALEIVVSSKAVAASGVAENAPVEQKIGMLKGLRFSSSPPGNANYTLLTEMLKSAGLTPQDVQYQTLTDTTAMVESMRNDRIDAAMWSVGPLSNLLQDNTGVRWVSIGRGDVPSLAQIPYVSVFARAEWVDSNPDLVKRVHAAYAATIKRMKDDPEGTSVVIREKYFPNIDPALWQDSFRQGALSFIDGVAGTEEGWNQLIALQAQSTGKDYAPAAFSKVVADVAQAK
jgi:ABC-type nitrate/sulfonate/bicarbonate transport system substrate-binding protein